MWEGREGGEEGIVGRMSEVEKGEASQEEGGEEGEERGRGTWRWKWREERS